MGIGKKFRDFFFLDEDDEYMEEEYMEETEREYTAPIKSQNQKVVSLASAQQATKMILMELRSYDDVQGVADHLTSRRAVVVNLQRIDREQAKRIVDFLSGTIYAIGGEIKTIGTNTFLCAPDNVGVSGAISVPFDEDTSAAKRW